MTVALHDASILIDLITIDILQAALLLPYRMQTTPFILEELYAHQRKMLHEHIAKGNLRVEEEDSQEIERIAALFGKHGALSFADCSICVCAKRLGAILLTGDQALRRVAENEGIRVHGMLWIFDELLVTQRLTATEAAKKLRHLMQSGRRLPRAECLRRLELWEAA